MATATTTATPTIATASTSVATSEAGSSHGVLYNDVVAIGAGLSGIALVARLKIVHNFTDVHLYERNSSAGGTWWVNSYPGAACDVPSALYSFSFAQNPEWTCMMPPHNEIKAYTDSVAAKYGAHERITYHTEVIRAEWHDDISRWRVRLRSLQTKEEYTHECKLLYSCAGALVVPNWPDIEGLSGFQGEVMHSARWRHDVDLEGKRVAVFGNGCTAAQIVPNIVDRAATVNQFIRTKHYILPAPYLPITPTLIWVLKHVPLTMRALRFIVFAVAEFGLRFQKMGWFGRVSRWLKKKQVVAYMKRTAPAKYHEDLIPDFEIGCKRRIMDPGYLRSLHNPKINLINISSSQVRIDGDRIVTTSANSTTSYPTDVIVFATGFKTNRFLEGYDVIGRGGKNLRDHWQQDLGGPGAYNCAVNHGFPNFFIVLGPNHATGHTSAIMAIENVINYSMKVIEPVLTGDVDVVEIKESAEKTYVQRLQSALRNTVWATGCGSWYTNEKGWNAMSYPWSQAHFWYRCARVKMEDWNYKYSSPEGRKRANARRSGLWTYTVASGLVATTAALGFGLVSLGDGKNPLDGLMGLLDKGARNVVGEWIKSVKE